MTEQQNKVWYKPVTIGCERLPTEIESMLQVVNILDINICTDSKELNHHLLITGANQPPPEYLPWATLNYITKNTLPFKGKSGQAMQGMEVDYPGDLYATPRLDHYFFCGIDKLGTLLSMVYGLRSFVGIERGILGLHSSLLYDKDTGQGHLLVGRNKIGKSTLGQMIEEHTGRYIMVADDWAEVQMISKNPIVSPVSPIYSPVNPNINYEFALNSFGKQFFWKHNIHPLPLMDVGKVIELYPDNQPLVSDEFLSTALSHIPFLNQELNEEMFTCPLLEVSNIQSIITRRKRQIIYAYQQLVKNKETIKIINNHATTTAEEATKKVLDALMR